MAQARRSLRHRHRRGRADVLNAFDHHLDTVTEFDTGENTMSYTKPEIAQLGAADVLIEQTGEKFGPRRLDPIDPTGHFFMFNPAYDLDE